LKKKQFLITTVIANHSLSAGNYCN